MPSIFRKNFHLCFSKIRCLPTSASPPLTLDDDDDDEEEYFSHIPTNCITIHNNPHTPFIVKNFNSIYDNNPSTSSSTTAITNIIDELSSTTSSTSTATEYPDLSAIFASQRLFVSSPGLSNSILEPPSSSLNDAGDDQQKLVGGGVPIKKDSPDPYADFRRSMLEMIEARDKERKKNQQHLVVLGSGVDESDDLSEYLQELLLCYLNLNPKHMHKFIIGAFADLLVSLMSSHSDESNVPNQGSRPRLL